MKKLLLPMFILLIPLLLTSCGFHPSAAKDFPPQLNPLYIDSAQPYGPLEQRLRQGLRTSNLVILDSPTTANASLKIISQSLTQTITGMSQSTQVQEYMSVASVTYAILNPQGVTIFGPKTLKIIRNFSVNSNQILGANTQQNSVIDGVQRDLVFLLLNQLAAKNAHIAIEQAYAKSSNKSPHV